MNAENNDYGKVIYPQLSYRIIGILFEVWNAIGHSHKEKYIQKAIEIALMENKISFQKELKVDLKFKDSKIGTYFLDFLIENKIILEIKKREYFSYLDIKQIYSYLKAKKLQLGIIAHFTSKGIRFKRVLNIG